MTKFRKLTTFGIVIAVLVAGGFSIWFSNPNRKIRNEIAENGCDQSATSTNCAELIKKAQESEKPKVVDVPIEDTSSTQSGKIDEHLTVNNTYRDVDLCGEIYRGKQVILDGVDVLQRVAELGRNESVPHKDIGIKICDGIKPGPYLNKREIEILEVITFPSSDLEELPVGSETYVVYISGWSFLINLPTGTIYTLGGYDG
ncbi:hypothetical protein IIA94_03040, partial [Patescibacteria group bacterium]|nr:hypothetical protein [Patescibacteria group bacterium]